MIKRFLIVASNGECRVTRRRPQLSLNEFAFEVNVTVPDSWARVLGSVDIELPEAPTPTIDVAMTADPIEEMGS
jgi:hypothetical protein